MWTNYHCHTDYCDGKKPIAEIVTEAREKGMIALGISSHAPLPFERQWCMRLPMFQEYLEDISKAKFLAPNLQLYSGLEIDFIPGKTSPDKFKEKLDYTIGSIHFVEWLPDGEGWEIDSTYAQFERGLFGIFGGDIKWAVRRYYELTREMVKNSPPNIIGHMDKIKLHNRQDHFFREDEPWYKEQIQLTLDVIRKSECIIEVNTRGIYQKKTDSTYPSPWVLEEIGKRNIPITLSSDAHHPDDLSNHFPDTAKELLKIGFKKLRILLDGRWTDVPFSEHGINHRNVTNNPMA